MSPLEQLLQQAASSTHAAAIAQRQRQGEGEAMQGVLDLVAAALRGAQTAALLEELLGVLLARGMKGCCASLAEAEAHKAEGNAAFRQSRLEEAARYYSEALRLVDETTPAGATLAAGLYNNRALCLLRSAPPDWRGAEQDASCAITCDPTNSKAWYRRACARREGGDGAGALRDAQQALALQRGQQQAGGGGTAGTNAAAAAAAAEEELAGLVAALERHLQLQPQPQEAPLAAPKACAGSDNSVLTSAAAAHASAGKTAAAATAAAAAALAAQRSGGALTVGWSAEAGRFLTAAQDLPPGTDVLREAPFALALTRSGRKACCHGCGGPMPTQGPAWYCRACPLPRYCSLDCRAADWAHAAGGPECGRPWAALLPQEAVLALRALRRLCGSEGSSPEAQQVASLEVHFAELEPAEAARLAALALVTHATWQSALAQAQPGQRAQALSLGRPSALDLLRMLCQVRVNGIAVVPPARSSEADRLGLALYATTSMMNHACRPTASLYFEGATAVVRTLQATPRGAPLLHCYGPQQGEMSWQQRQAVLQRQYCFRCSCTACAGGPTAADAALVGLRCLHCGGEAGEQVAAGSNRTFSDPAGSGAAADTGRACDADIGAGGAVQPPCSVPPGIVSRFPFEPTPAVPGTGSSGGSGDNSSGGGSACTLCGAHLSRKDWDWDYLPRLQQAAELAAGGGGLLQAAEGDVDDYSDAETAERAVRLLQGCLEERQRLLHPRNQLLGQTHDALAHALHAARRPTAAAPHLRFSLAVLTWHYPPTSTAVAFQQLKLAAMLRLAAAAGDSNSGTGLRPGPATASGAEEEAEKLEQAARAVLGLHFGPKMGGTVL